MPKFRDFEENESLWALCVPGRDKRKHELGMVPDIIKENLSAESLEKFMHMGVLAYAASCYLADIVDELKHIETYKERQELREMCFNRVVNDLFHGADIKSYADEEVEGWVRGIAQDFLSLEIQSPVQTPIVEEN